MASKRVNLTIREENLTEWEQIEHKSEWLNDMLSGAETGLERKIKKIAREVFEELMTERGEY